MSFEDFIIDFHDNGIDPLDVLFTTFLFLAVTGSIAGAAIGYITRR